MPGGMGGHGHGHGHGHGGRGGGGDEEVDNKKFYELLEIERNANEADIKKAFRKAALKHHPDRGGDPEAFKAVNKSVDCTVETLG